MSLDGKSDNAMDKGKIKVQATMKSVAQLILRGTIMWYLQKLQGGDFGDPTARDLQEAGELHRFLEN